MTLQRLKLGKASLLREGKMDCSTGKGGSRVCGFKILNIVKPPKCLAFKAQDPTPSQHIKQLGFVFSS